jgi:hypothetical protein
MSGYHYERNEQKINKETEEVGFEPTDPFRPSVFKTDAIGHSATLPLPTF